MGLGPNLSPYCRWFPGMPRGWWAYQSQSYPQTTYPQMNVMGQPNLGTLPSQSALPSPLQTPPQMLQQQPYTFPQMPYGQGMFPGLGMGAGFGGLGMGMRYRRRMGGPPNRFY